MLRLHADNRGIGFEPVGKHHLHALGAEHDVKIGEDRALVDNDDAATDTLVAVFVDCILGSPPIHSTIDCRTRS